MDTSKLLNSLALLFVSIGALNWGLVAFANFDLLSTVSGGSAIVSNVLYAIVALFGLYTLYLFVQSLSK